MIRINLLGVAKPVSHTAGPSEGMSPAAILVPGALLVVLGLVTGFAYMYLSSSIATLNKQLADQQREKARLASIAEQNKSYEQRISLLEQRKKMVDTLQNSRVGPVEMMHVLGSLANRSNNLYLLSVSNKGDRIVMQGMASSTDAIANFIGSLQQSGTFGDVQLRRSFEDDRAKQLNFKFDLDCIYRQSTPGASSTPAGKPATTPAPPPRRAGM